MGIKILLDTDIGNNIDDALCLAYLLAHPQCEIIGITTVTGEASKRAKLASAICNQAGFPNIPIYAGSEQPLLVPQKQTNVFQSLLDKWKHDKEFPLDTVNFLRYAIYKHPYKLHLLSIGPLTNIALLFKLDPLIPSLLASHHCMCGKFTNAPIEGRGPVEWNASVDPHACQIVLNTKVKNQRVFGLDVTTQLVMSVEEVKMKFTHPLLRSILDISEHWLKQHDSITFNDPLAGAAIFNPSLCTYQRGTVNVDCCTPGLMGATNFNADKQGSTHIATEVNASAFFEKFFSVFSS